MPSRQSSLGSALVHPVILRSFFQEMVSALQEAGREVTETQVWLLGCFSRKMCVYTTACVCGYNSLVSLHLLSCDHQSARIPAKVGTCIQTCRVLDFSLLFCFVARMLSLGSLHDPPLPLSTCCALLIFFLACTQSFVRPVYHGVDIMISAAVYICK